jgi:hypothetical protein
LALGDWNRTTTVPPQSKRRKELGWHGFSVEGMMEPGRSWPFAMRKSEFIRVASRSWTVDDACIPFDNKDFTLPLSDRPCSSEPTRIKADPLLFNVRVSAVTVKTEGTGTDAVGFLDLGFLTPT